METLVAGGSEGSLLAPSVPQTRVSDTPRWQRPAPDGLLVTGVAELSGTINVSKPRGGHGFRDSPLVSANGNGAMLRFKSVTPAVWGAQGRRDGPSSGGSDLAPETGGRGELRGAVQRSRPLVVGFTAADAKGTMAAWRARG